jgi:hypothetical protein
MFGLADLFVTSVLLDLGRHLACFGCRSAKYSAAEATMRAKTATISDAVARLMHQTISGQ